jgi:hypothetical protein
VVSTYTPNAKFEKPGFGDYSANWSTPANNTYDLIDANINAITSVDITGAANVTLTSLNGAADQARSATLVVKGTPTGQLSVLVPNSITRNYAVRSKVTNSNYVVVNNAAQVGSGVTCASGEQFYFNTDGVRCRKLGVVPKGTIMFWAGTTGNIPAGWAAFSAADGKVLSAQTSVGNYPGTSSSVSIGTAGSHSHTGLTGDTTLTLSQIPSHAHAIAGQAIASGLQPGGTTLNRIDPTGIGTYATTSVGGDGSHNHSISTDGSHTHPIGITVGNPDSYGLILIRKVT